MDIGPSKVVSLDRIKLLIFRESRFWVQTSLSVDILFGNYFAFMCTGFFGAEFTYKVQMVALFAVEQKKAKDCSFQENLLFSLWILLKLLIYYFIW